MQSKPNQIRGLNPIFSPPNYTKSVFSPKTRLVWFDGQFPEVNDTHPKLETLSEPQHKLFYKSLCSGPLCICNVAHIESALDKCFSAQTLSVLEFINLWKHKNACHLSHGMQKLQNISIHFQAPDGLKRHGLSFLGRFLIFFYMVDQI